MPKELSAEWKKILYPKYNSTDENCKVFHLISINDVKVIIQQESNDINKELVSQGVLFLNLDIIKHTIEKIFDFHCNENRQLIVVLLNDISISNEYHIIIKPLVCKTSYKPNYKEIVNEFLIENHDKPIVWNDEKKKCYNFIDINSLHHIAFTDGSCNPNNKSAKSRGGYALVFVSGSLIDTVVYGNLDISKCFASNIRAEGFAIIRTLELVDNNMAKWNKLTIVTDCEFWINMIENFMPKWKASTFEEKSNPDLTKRLWLIYNKVINKGCVVFKHVKSHNKEGWKSFPKETFERFCHDQNEYVDKMCGLARINLCPNDEKITNIHHFK